MASNDAAPPMLGFEGCLVVLMKALPKRVNVKGPPARRVGPTDATSRKPFVTVPLKKLPVIVLVRVTPEKSMFVLPVETFVTDAPKLPFVGKLKIFEIRVNVPGASTSPIIVKLQVCSVPVQDTGLKFETVRKDAAVAGVVANVALAANRQANLCISGPFLWELKKCRRFFLPILIPPRIITSVNNKANRSPRLMSDSAFWPFDAEVTE